MNNKTKISSAKTNKNLSTTPSNQQLSYELIKTSALTALGTSIFVAMHHQYRKQRQPEARLQDYIRGAQARLNAFSVLSSPAKTSTPAKPLIRLRCAFDAAKRAYSNPDETNANKDKADQELAALYTTTRLARPVCWVSGVAAIPKNMSAHYDSEDNSGNDFGVVGIDADRQLVWQTLMPERVHDIVVQPISNSRAATDKQSRDVVVMGRRPSKRFWVLDAATGQVKRAIKASADRHFYGHACYSLDGNRLYVTQNDTITLSGKIGVYNARNYQKIAEFDSYGIGPHELIMHSDGETLIIANGGIKTEQASREELNLDTMRPSLVYLNLRDGQLLEQITPEHNQMSVRHLAIHDNGTVAIGIQFQGERHINIPLVLTHKRGNTQFTPLVMPDNQWQRFHQYIASVAVDSEHDQVCVATPMGGCAAIFDLKTHSLVDTVRLPDCAGVATNFEKSGFIVSDGHGYLSALHVTNSEAKADNQPSKACIVVDGQQHLMSFDNHLQALS
nr:DUF1513 domain-containing protein [uncultured Psychrobacter sp.]